MILGWLGNQDQFCYVLNFGSVTEVKSDETCYQAWNLTIQPKENFGLMPVERSKLLS